MAVAAPRGRADRDEHRLGVGDRGGEIGREGQALLAHVAGDEILQARLVDRHDAPAQRRDLALVEIDADGRVAEVREAGAGDEPDVA